MQLCHDSGAMVIPGDCIGRISTITAATASTTTATKTTTEQQHLSSTPHLSIQYVAGDGTYVRNGSILASIVGHVIVSSTTIPITSELKDEKAINMEEHEQHTMPQQQQPLLEMVTISVLPPNHDDDGYRAKQQVIRVGQTILGRVVRIGMMTQQVMVDIVANPYGVLDAVANGTIRRDDVTKLLAVSSSSSTSTGNNATPKSSQNTTSTTAVLPIQQLSQSFRVGDWIAAKVISLGDDSSSNQRRNYYLSTAESSLGVIYAICATSGQRMIPVSHREMQCPTTGIIEARKCARPPPNIPV